MSEKEEEFPFQQFLEALQESKNLRKGLKNILSAICQKNIYWTYSALSTLIEILKSKDQDPFIKCRSLEAATVLFQTCEYPVVVFAEVYLLPILIQLATYKGKKADDLVQYFFQQTQKSQDTEENRKLSLEFIQRGVELIFFSAKIKPFRTVQTEELKQESSFSKAVKSIQQRGVQESKQPKWCNQSKEKEYRKLYLDKLKAFSSESDQWTEFLLVNLLEEVQTNKKELLQLRFLLSYGESFISSAIINFCEEELMDMTENLDLKKKYLGVLNELVRNGDIEAIIMVKNSEFLPTILAHISKLPGQQGINVGENIFPEVKATKQIKREFYTDFLRCLETWAIVMPQDYDSEDFNIKSIYQHLKNVKKFKFPENMLLNRYQKEIKENLERNKERNDRLLEILENMEESKQQSISKTPLSKMSNVLQKTAMLAPSHLQLKLQEMKKNLKNLVSNQESADNAFKSLVQFKDNWITYLQSLDFQGSDENHIQALINAGEKCVEQIQLVVPLHGSLSKGKITFRQFKQKVNECLEFHMDVSQHSISKKSNLLDKSKSFKASRLALSKMGKSKFASKLGKSLLDKIKAKSRMDDKTKMNMSKAMDRSNMFQKSHHLDISKSRMDTSKNAVDLSKHLVDTSVKKNQIKKQQSKTLNPKNSQPQEEEPSQDPSVSITKNYQIPERQSESSFKEESKKKISEVKKSRVQEKNISRVKSRKDEQQEEEKEKIIRVADYQVDIQPAKQPLNSPRPSHSRQKSGSRLLMRRSQGSRLDKSCDSNADKKSVSGRKVKQSSLYKRNQIEQNKTIKISQPPSEISENKPKDNQTISKIINGGTTPIRQEKSHVSPQQRDEDKLGKFSSEAGEISSIHSGSNVRVTHHSPEKVLNLTAQISDINYSKEVVKGREIKQDFVEYIANELEPSPVIVGDYYESPNKKKPRQQIFKKKSSNDDSPSLEKSGQSPKFKNLFQKKTQNIDYVDQTPKKTKRETSENNYIKPTIESQREQRHTTKQIGSSKELGLYQTKKEIQPTGREPSSKEAEVKISQDEKNKQIQALQKKIKQLQKESMSMKMKLAAKDNEIRSFKSLSKNGSERGFAHFTVTSNSNFEKSSLRSSSASRRGGEMMTPFQKQIESNYKQYLERIKGSTFRKSLLKMKCLVHRTDELQIGCLSQRCQDILESTLYVTPHRYDMIDFSISVIHDHRLKIKVAPQSVKVIPALKQQKIHLTIQVDKIPFCLPEFQINYKADSQYCSNYNRLTLPIAFNKFCLIKPLSLESKTQKHLDYVKTDNFKVNPKVVKVQKVKDSFPNFLCIPPMKGRDQEVLAASCDFGGSSFNLMINIHEKWSWIQGFLKKGDIKAMNFLICTLKEIIDGSRK